MPNGRKVVDSEKGVPLLSGEMVWGGTAPPQKIDFYRAAWNADAFLR